MPIVSRAKKKCARCKNSKSIDNFNLCSKSKDGYFPYCRKCWAAKMRVYVARRSPASRIIQSARCGASMKGIEFSIKIEDLHDLPKRCPYLDIELDYKRAIRAKRKVPPNAASIDRIDSSKGYVPGNVQIISFLANRMKQNATPEQLVAFALGVLKLHAPSLKPL